jgi:hypothetical protein
VEQLGGSRGLFLHRLDVGSREQPEARGEFEVGVQFTH